MVPPFYKKGREHHNVNAFLNRYLICCPLNLFNWKGSSEGRVQRAEAEEEVKVTGKRFFT
jgi:hypothetical protein